MLQLIKILVVVTAFSCSFARNGRTENTVVMLGMTLPPSRQSSSTPEFLHAIRDCWSSNYFSPEDCVPPFTTMPRPNMDNVNTVTAIKGAVQKAANIVNYNFNLSVMQTVQEKVPHMYIRLTKEALSVDDSVSMETKCNIHYGIPLTLTMTAASSAATTSTYQSTVILNSKNIEEKIFVNYTGFTQALYESFSNERGVVSTISFKLSVSGTCSNVLSPADLGFSSSQESFPWLVAFSINPEVDKARVGERLSELTVYAKNKRQAMNASAETSTIVESPCRMYTHWVPFSKLQLGDTIIMPHGFYVNYCLGTCTFPQISSPKYNTTKHSHIQSIAAHYSPDYVPTACCVPHEYSDMEVLYEQLPGVFAMYNLTSAAVKSCGCK